MKRKPQKALAACNSCAALPGVPCRRLPLRRSPQLAYGHRVRPRREPRADRHGRLPPGLGRLAMRPIERK